jgi:glutathione peroxidase
MSKIEVNGPGRSDVYKTLTQFADSSGHSGDIRWNFEKFLVTPDGSVQRFSPTVTPEDPILVGAIEAALN